MVQVRDPSWAGFAVWLSDRMDASRIGPTAMAKYLGREDRITPSTITKWRAGSQHPRLADLPAVAVALGVDPVDVAIELGVLPGSYAGGVQIDMAIRLAEFQAHIADLHAERMSQSIQSGMANLLNAVLQKQRWGLAVQPAVEGPPGQQLRLANRLAFRRTDDVQPRVEDVLSDFGPQLRELHASSSYIGGWPADGDVAPPVRFSVPVYTQPHRPSGPAHAYCPAVVVLSTTIKSWAPVFSRHLADDLGYGLTSGLDLAASTHNKSIDLTVSKERADQSFLLIRNAPARYVSYHYESSEVRDSRTMEALSTMPADDTKIVWMREDDQLLQFAVNHRSDLRAREPERDLEATVRHRDDLDVVLTHAALRDRVLRVEVHLPEGCDPKSDPNSIRRGRVEATITAASHTFNEMVRRKWVADNRA